MRAKSTWYNKGVRVMRVATSFVALLALVPRPAGGAAGSATEPTEAVSETSADAAYERARRLFAAEDYLAAADALEEAYAVDPNPSYLYQRGHALRLAGSCAAALPVFREVQDLAETPTQRQEVQPWIEQCERVVHEATPKLPPSPIEAVEPVEAMEERGPEPLPAPQDQPSARRDVFGGVAVGVGAVLALAGAGMVTGASVLAGRPSGEPEMDYERRASRVRGLEIGGGVVLGLGLVALITGAVRYGVLARRSARDPSSGLAVRF